jgi:hypothetical protein
LVKRAFVLVLVHRDKTWNWGKYNYFICDLILLFLFLLNFKFFNHFSKTNKVWTSLRRKEKS